ncbi:hypothetical protein OFB51_25160, partial [Escherichia coli]|nr:hypothetical protein [Escherichia coli]
SAKLPLYTSHGRKRFASDADYASQNGLAVSVDGAFHRALGRAEPMLTSLNIVESHGYEAAKLSGKAVGGISAMVRKAN